MKHAFRSVIFKLEACKINECYFFKLAPADRNFLKIEDNTYERRGAVDKFMVFEPFAGKRHIEIFEHRRRVEWAEGMRIVLRSV